MKKFSGNSGQTLTDRMTAAKHSISGAGLAKVVCKATTEELIPPKQKHLNYLIDCTKESNVSIPELANNLLERLNNSHWAVVFKALISIHHLMNYGNERFTQYLASNNCRLSLPSFQDRTSLQGSDMSRFISRYSNYVHEKAMSYRALAFDFCKVKRGSEDAALRTLNVEQLLKTLPHLVTQFDALLAFDVTANELTNGIINSAFLLLYKDASRLFVVFNDGIINMLTKFFEAMSKKQCKDALEIYRKFLTRSERLNEFSRIAESAGVERADLAVLEKHPSSFLEAMESHLGQTDGKKISRSSSSNSVGSATVNAAPAAASSSQPAVLTEAQRQQLLQEEQEYLDRLQAQRQKQNQAKPQEKPASSNDADFLFDSPPKPQAGAQASKSLQDLNFASFEAPAVGHAAAGNTASLGYAGFPSTQPAPAPFSSGFSAFPQPQPALTTSVPFMQPQHQQLQFQPQQQQQQASGGFDPFGSVLEPTRNNNQQYNQAGNHNSGNAGKKPAITADLDSSIASLASSLSIKDAQFGKGSWNQQQQQHQMQNNMPVRISAGPTVNWAAAAQQQQQQQMRPMGVYAAQMPMGAAAMPLAAPGVNPFMPVGGGWQTAQQNNGTQGNVNDPFGAL